MIKPSITTGNSYPKSPYELRSMLEKFFQQTHSPEFSNLKSLIVPRSNYVYSSEIAMKGYALFTQSLSKHYKIFLLNSSPSLSISASIGNFTAYDTPFGLVSVDNDICQELLRYDDFDFIIDTHLKEDSFNIQLPFLQYLQENNKFFMNFSIIPILTGNITANVLAKILLPYWEQDNSFFIIPSDLKYDSSNELITNKYHSTMNINQNCNLENIQEFSDYEQVPISTIINLISQSKEFYQCSILDYINYNNKKKNKSKNISYASIGIRENI